jgi:hypothetical protein
MLLCPQPEQLADLPSADAAKRLIDGEPDAFLAVVGTTLLRSMLIGAGMSLAGADRSQVVKQAVAASVAVEVFVLGWFWIEKSRG